MALYIQNKMIMILHIFMTFISINSFSYEKFDEYIHRKVEENTLIEGALDAKYQLNDRQRIIKIFAYKGQDYFVTPSSYIELYKVSKVTAYKIYKY